MGHEVQCIGAIILHKEVKQTLNHTQKHCVMKHIIASWGKYHA